MRVYLDSCVIIYRMEAEAPAHASAAERVYAHMWDPAARLVCSRLARLECRVGPLRAGDATLLARYDAFFTRQRVVVVEVTAAIVERATELRARYGFATPDAIHVASAIETKADVFLTGDRGLSRCDQVRVEVIG